MLIAIQVSEGFGSWDSCKAVAHEVDSWEEAVSHAYVVSRQFGCRPVRLTSPGSSEYGKSGAAFQAYIGRLSGTYIQAK